MHIVRQCCECWLVIKRGKQQNKNKQTGMKLLERNQMHQTRFSQSFSQFPNRPKILSSTRQSFTSRNNYKLPQLSRSFSNSSCRNSKQRLSDLDDSVLDLTKKVHDLKLQTRESRRFTNFLKEDLGERLLGDHKQKLSLKINTLDKYAKITRKQHEDRTQRIKDDCQNLNDSSIEIARLLRNINERVDRIQNTMEAQNLIQRANNFIIQDVKAQESMRQQDQNYTKWLIRHEEVKSKASEKAKEKVEQFLMQQSINPSRVEDDHYKTWRYNKQFRDIEDSNKFVGFKTFRHKPNYDMDKYFTERERREISYIADKSSELVKSKIIPQQFRSRSLRSQGPLNPKHTFRDRKSDHQYFQPRMRYTNITDKERFMEASVTYDKKFSNLYQSFEMTKSKIGQPKVSPSKKGKDQMRPPPQLDMVESTYSDVQKDTKYHYEAPLNQEQNQSRKISRISANKHTISPTHSEKRRKSYFKSGKTMAVNGNILAKTVMMQTQYDRKKDLTNIVNNMDNESFIKRPIL